MSVQDALEMWLGALDSADDDSSRCLFLGAGFTKATNDEAPLFDDFKAELARSLVRSPGFERLSPRVKENIADAIRLGTEKKSLDPSEMIEMVDHLSGGGAVADIVFSEPISPRAQRHSQLPYRNPPGDAADSVFRTLSQWQRLFKTTSPTFSPSSTTTPRSRGRVGAGSSRVSRLYVEVVKVPNRGQDNPVDALTSMREEMARNAFARIAVGGKTSAYWGRYPGIEEETRLAVERGSPLPLGGFGGRARVLTRRAIRRAFGAHGDEEGWSPIHDEFRNGPMAWTSTPTSISWRPRLPRRRSS